MVLDRDSLRREALLWLRQAEADLRVAIHSLEFKDWFASAFWSHQAAEKALKSLLLSRGRSVRGHNLLYLAEVVKTELGIDVPEEVMKCLRRLNPHYTVARYPNAANGLPYQIYDEDTAREAIEYGRRVLEWVKQFLR